MTHTVLFVDADTRGNKLARIVLEPEGWVVVSAGSAHEAFSALREFVPALIVTELGLHDMDGVSFIAALKAAPATQQIPIVVLTARNGRDVEARVRAAGCVAFLRKPIDVMTFASQLLAAIGDRT